MRDRFPNRKFEFFNIAEGGTPSSAMAEEVEARFDYYNITSLTSNDIIFLDHSSNDETKMNFEAWNLELLISTIYANFVDSDPPTIILLEQLPICSKQNKNCYTNEYRKAGKYYNLPIFSFFEAINSENAKKKRPPIITHITTHFALHLPYSTHLYMADLLAGLVENLLSNCSNREIISDRGTAMTMKVLLGSARLAASPFTFN